MPWQGASRASRAPGASGRRFFFLMNADSIRRLKSFATGAKVSSKSTAGICSKPHITSLALYRIPPPDSCLVLKTHLELMGLTPDGTSSSRM